MARHPKPDNPFRWFDSSPEVIQMVVMLYVRFPLSLRNVEDLAVERGIEGCGVAKRSHPLRHPASRCALRRTWLRASSEAGCRPKLQRRRAAVHYVYQLESIASPGHRYVGVTSDLPARLKRHNSGGSPHTSKFARRRFLKLARSKTDARHTSASGRLRVAARFSSYLRSFGCSFPGFPTAD